MVGIFGSMADYQMWIETGGSEFDSEFNAWVDSIAIGRDPHEDDSD